ncbi:alpha-galactosidase [Arthrobacter sp. RIT-PI-e]|uniref:alpha-galactosidase n=1 Tax=Arthrobacter sp. RIT-PI-e TaxID=1681197 RepID=UPI0006764674|nr:alpha-galactosidase [Arthrobacter sp. RIT-PI-e]KNC19577.1 alpha-galactosidase [Arthrobacter sp. RIT-PI-e]
MTSAPLHLSRGGTSVVLEPQPHGLPALIYWGPDLGALGAAELAGVVRAQQPQRVSGGIDVPARTGMLPLESVGWQGTPGLVGDRGGTHLHPRFDGITVEQQDAAVLIEGHDDVAGLTVTAHLALTASGLIGQRIVLTNTGSGPYEVRALRVFLPLPPSATEILDTTGRHLRERSPQRSALTAGTHARTSRRGRPGADATVLLAAGVAGFGFEHGAVHGVHVAWSGNQHVLVEKTPAGPAYLAAGEELSPGEVVLGPGESYSTPEVLGSWGNGLNELSSRFHAHLRSRSVHPRRPRPVTLNTWEAVYFDLDLPRLLALADRAAALGVERFVLDDGWFRGRRDDTSGLGDWYVDETVWPDGLAPIIDHVRRAGMEFGLWFEPEMVNPDSDLARAHPDWILRPEGRLPLPGRQQQVLNLGHPEAYAYILERLDDILSANEIAYVKWDHNRDLLEAADARTGQAGVHRHVQALYRLLDELRRRHPRLEIESCASGGARVDLGILARTDRIWTSDCIDPIERLVNQKYTGLVVPPELMGMHVGGPVSHSTGRAHTLPFRAGTAIFGHYGIEWDISDLSAGDAEVLGRYVRLHRARREDLHAGTVVHADLADPAMDLRGTVSGDRSRALFGYSLTGSSASYPPGALTFPGLDPDALYVVDLAVPEEGHPGNGQSPLPWLQAALDGAPLRLSGRVLQQVGLQAPVLLPEQTLLIELRAEAP